MDLEYSTMSSDGSSVGSELSQESTRCEECHIEGVRLQLPQGLCENKNIFKEFFSYRTWRECFTEQQRQHLKNFLPTFPEKDAQEKEETLQCLFARANMRFGSPLSDFQAQLKNGYYRPDIAKMRSLMRKAQFREYKYQQRRYYFRLMKEILLSRQHLLETAFSQPPGALPKMERIPHHPPPRNSPAEQKARRRYFQELAAIRQEVGESDHSSEDDNYPEGPPPRLSKKQKRQLSTLECSLSPDMRHVTSTLSLKPSGFDLESNVTTSYNPYELNEELYKALLLNHKRRRMEGDDHPELNILGITTQDIAMRAQLGKRPPVSRTNHNVGSETKTPTKKRTKNETSNNKGTPTLVAAHISQMRHSISSPQALGGCSSNGSDIGDSEDDDATLDHSVTDDMERVDVEGEVESPLVASKTTPVRTPVAASRSRRTNSSGSSPRTSRTGTSGAGSRSILQRRIKVEAEEEVSEVFPVASTNSSSNFTVPTSGQPFQQLANSIALPKTTNPPYTGRHITAATLSDLDGIDMMNLPVDLDESPTDPMDISLDDIKPTPELMQETHACFFSLIRDVICSTPDHRMSLTTLEDRLKAWQENPISPLNDWYCIAADSWLLMLPSAISFLSGDFPDAQPEDFVPYVEYKPNLQAYQWIGAGRDSDAHLQPLCQHWLDHRDEMTARPVKEEEAEEELGEGAGEERAASPPPPRCPTTWVVHSSTQEEKECFREQERLRYENPHRAFTYRMHNYESVVGPVKGVYNQSIGVNKPRGHSLLVADRPNFVTILALVRDATARLPNGEGTRTDICELLKDSQYLAPVSQESYLHSVVSGALDRLHYETDPCVKYDTKRKIWIYLHRGRTEEEFERLHQQQQGMAKTKKSSSQRKASRSKQQKENAAVAKEASTAPQVPATSVQNPPLQASLPVVTSVPVVTAAGKSVTTRGAARNPVIPRTFTLPSGQTVQNLHVSTSSGLQTIQVTTSPTVLAGGVAAGKSLLTAPVTQQQLTPTSIVKTVAVTTPVATSTSTPILKTVTLTPQQMQAMSAARGLTAAAAIKTSAASTPTALRMQQKAPPSNRPTAQPSLPSPKAMVNATSAQLVNVSQVQLVGSKSPQPVGSPKPMLTAGGKTLMTTGISGVKLVNAVKAITTPDGSQQQTIFIKQQQQQQPDQPPQTIIGTIQQQPQLLQHQHANKQAAAIAQLQQQLKQQLQQKQQQQQQQQQLQQAVTVGATTSPATPQRVVTTMSVLGQPRVMARVGGKPIPVSHMALPTQLQQQAAATTSAQPVSGAATVVKQQPPMVAKVLTSAQGQVISMESLLAHQKQHGTLPQGTALRVTTGGKPGQTSLIQIPSSTQFAVVSQGNLLSVGQPRVLQTQLTSQQAHAVTTPTLQQQAVTVQQPQQQQQQQPQQQQQQQAQATKLVTAAGKPLVAGTTTTATANLRMIGPTAGGLNLAHIGGKPVLLASKAQSAPIQGPAGQNVILTSQAAGGHQTVVLASQALRAQGGTLVLQQGGAQQILLPPGFQGGTLNIKTLQGLQGLQGLKVIPLSQATAAATNKGRQQVYARIISPGLRPATANIIHQNAAAAVTLQGTSGEVSPANTQLGAGPSSTTEQ
ncbi:nuclear factor related to kappa-B-binding protein-like isoform X2 [Periplaneta americana]|uniref:nuclear factor related to kappa-B-binding protein-like isoform X2 n=1 Tax=Periplaneta americana TaxID=6978 RepID=UPI0037E7E212